LEISQEKRFAQTSLIEAGWSDAYVSASACIRAVGGPTATAYRDGIGSVLSLLLQIYPLIAKAFADAGGRPTTSTLINVDVCANPRIRSIFRVSAPTGHATLLRLKQPKSPLLRYAEATLASAQAFLYAAASGITFL